MKKYLLLGSGLVLMILSLYLIFVWVPTERIMGIVQRIFYLMVPAGWLAMLSYLVIFIGSIAYLKTRKTWWDTVAHSSAEIGIVTTTLVLIVGSLWARPIWGVWWSWEPRLTATLILWFIYLSYFLVRSFAGEESRGARFAAIIGIIGFIDIPIIGMATSLWRGLHPPLLIFQEGGLAQEMMLTLAVSIAAYTALYFVLLGLRVSLRSIEVDIKEIKGPVT